MNIADFTTDQKKHLLTHEFIPLGIEDGKFVVLCLGCGKVTELPDNVALYYLRQKYPEDKRFMEKLDKVEKEINGEI